MMSAGGDHALEGSTGNPLAEDDQIRPEMDNPIGDSIGLSGQVAFEEGSGSGSAAGRLCLIGEPTPTGIATRLSSSRNWVTTSGRQSTEYLRNKVVY